ncbi:MAG: DUF3365 domain-containing protein [Desulfobacterales bacterium]|nr:DUF3365 domain-containing protein [Desulfobacterales bacterium]
MEAGGPDPARSPCVATRPRRSPRRCRAATAGVAARTSLKTRNPGNEPDAWEAKVLKEFEARKAKGEDPAQIEYAEIVTANGQKQFRYMKAIAIGPNQPCLKCHGATLDLAVSTRLKDLYPADKATGYKEGELRGAFTLSQSRYIQASWHGRQAGFFGSEAGRAASIKFDARGFAGGGALQLATRKLCYRLSVSANVVGVFVLTLAIRN